MARASWNGVVVAESDRVEIVEGNVYFPPDALQREYFLPSDHRSTCYWKGEASYFHVVVGEQVNRDAAWYYSDPKAAARKIAGFVAFWRGVTVES